MSLWIKTSRSCAFVQLNFLMSFHFQYWGALQGRELMFPPDRTQTKYRKLLTSAHICLYIKCSWSSGVSCLRLRQVWPFLLFINHYQTIWLLLKCKQTAFYVIMITYSTKLAGKRRPFETKWPCLLLEDVWGVWMKQVEPHHLRHQGKWRHVCRAHTLFWMETLVRMSEVCLCIRDVNVMYSRFAACLWNENR